jgi:hypothetical protein
VQLCKRSKTLLSSSSLISLPTTLCHVNTHPTNHTAPPAMPYRKLGRTSSHRWAMLRNMVTSLVEHERIRTTTAKVSQAEGWREGERQRDCVYTVGTRPWTARSVDGQGGGEWAGPERAGLMCLVQH